MVWSEENPLQPHGFPSLIISLKKNFKKNKKTQNNLYNEIVRPKNLLKKGLKPWKIQSKKNQSPKKLK